jgi:putative inorganic carbon (HCO3(-)) transporter
VQASALSRPLRALAVLAVGAAVIVGIARINPPGASTVYATVAAICALFAIAYLVWYVQPAVIFCGALVLSPVSGNWEQLGVPGFAAPDRLLLVTGIAAVLVRAPAARDRPHVQIEPVHWVMLAAVTYATVSAIVVDTLFNRGAFFKLLETFGVLPFLLFLVAPLAFRTYRERDLLLRTFVFLGLYLSLTTLFETLRLDALVFPKYILDPNYGIHVGRGRGPFVEAVTNGYAEYICAVACAIAWQRWRRDRTAFAWFSLGVAVLCIGGAFMSQQRSVWLGSVVATVIALVTFGEARRHAPAVLTMLAIVVGGSLVLIPGFAAQVQERGNNQATVWDRRNLARAAVNMVETRPLIGFGWNQFTPNSKNYFEQAADYPLAHNITRLRMHNVPLSYSAELGLAGLLLWIGALIAGVGRALATRGPPDVMLWRGGLLAVAICYVVISNFVPPSVFPNLSLWLWAGVVWSANYPRPDDAESPSAVANPSRRYA